jgi:hypothetical protein
MHFFKFFMSFLSLCGRFNYLDFWLSNLLVVFFQYELFSRTVSYIHYSNLNFCRIRLFPIVGFILFSRYILLLFF